MTYDTIEDLKRWWNRASFRERTLYLRLVYNNTEFISTSYGPKDPRAIAELRFEDLDVEMQHMLFSFQNPS